MSSALEATRLCPAPFRLLPPSGYTVLERAFPFRAKRGMWVELSHVTVSDRSWEPLLDKMSYTLMNLRIAHSGATG